MEYKPLDFATFEFRLLTLLNEEDADGVIRCSLRHASLIEPPQYRAISYCWGDPSITKPIAVNGHIVQITTNLEEAFREFKAQMITTFWVDALCINQDDLVERGLQVTRMSLIYSRAFEVVAWLGAEAEDSDVAINMLPGRRFYDASSTESIRSRDDRNSSMSRSSLSDYRSPLHSVETKGIEGTPLQALFERPFWRRVWIIQEIAKAQKVEFLCGSQKISWHQLNSSCNLLHGVPNQVLALREFRFQDRYGMRCSLSKALNKSIYFGSSDKRDKIYALLGLTSDGAEIVPTPNYVQSAESIYFQVIKTMISRCSHLSYLVEALPGNHAPSTTIQPDWTNLDEGIPSMLLTALEAGGGGSYSVSSRSSDLITTESKAMTILLRFLKQRSKSRKTPRKAFQEPRAATSRSGPRFRDGLRQCLYTRRDDLTARLSFSGLVARVYIFGPIISLSTPLKIPSEQGHDSFKTLLHAQYTFRNLSKRLFSRGMAKTATPTICSAVLNEFWHALLSSNAGMKDRLDSYYEVQTAYAMTNLCVQSNWTPVERPTSNKEHFSNWLYENQDLSYHGKTLRQWVETYSTTDAYKRKCRVDWGSEKRPDSSKSIPVEVDQAALLEAVADATKLNSRFAVGTNHLGLVPDEAREGDLICLFRNFQTPFIVRPDRDAYRYVCGGVFPPDAASAVAEERWERRRDLKAYREFCDWYEWRESGYESRKSRYESRKSRYESRESRRSDQQLTTIVIC